MRQSIANSVVAPLLPRVRIDCTGQGGIRVSHDIGSGMDIAFGASAAFIQDHGHDTVYSGLTSSGFGFGAGSGGSTEISSNVNFQTFDNAGRAASVWYRSYCLYRMRL